MRTSSNPLQELAAFFMAEPQNAQTLSGSIKLKIAQAGEIKTYLFDFQNSFNFQSDFSGESQASISMESEVFLEIMSGQLNAQRAFLQGLIAVEGDLDLIRKFSVYLGELSRG